MPKYTVHLIAPMLADAKVEVEAPHATAAEEKALDMVDSGEINFNWDSPDLYDAEIHFTTQDGET